MADPERNGTTGITFLQTPSSTQIKHSGGRESSITIPLNVTTMKGHKRQQTA